MNISSRLPVFIDFISSFHPSIMIASHLASVWNGSTQTYIIKPKECELRSIIPLLNALSDQARVSEYFDCWAFLLRAGITLKDH